MHQVSHSDTACICVCVMCLMCVWVDGWWGGDDLEVVVVRFNRLCLMNGLPEILDLLVEWQRLWM